MALTTLNIARMFIIATFPRQCPLTVRRSLKYADGMRW
jgi:hypothetical protein